MDAGRRKDDEFEYRDGINDKEEHADELSDLIRGFQSHVNLINYNYISEMIFKKSTSSCSNKFKNRLLKNGINVSFRKSRGLEKNAACGQLRRS